MRLTFPTEEIEISYRGKQHFLRRKESIPRTYHFILPKFYFSPTWRIFFFHVLILDFLRGEWTEIRG